MLLHQEVKEVRHLLIGVNEVEGHRDIYFRSIFHLKGDAVGETVKE